MVAMWCRAAALRGAVMLLACREHPRRVRRDPLAEHCDELSELRRIVIISAIGVGDSWSTVNPLFRALIRVSNIKIGYADHNGVEEVVRKSDVDWTLVRAVGLSNKTDLGPLHTTEVGGEKPGTLTVSRVEVARFCLDCVEKNDWIRRLPIIWNSKR